MAELLRLDAAPNTRDNAGRTPLMWASALNHTAVVRALCKGYADVDKPTMWATLRLLWLAAWATLTLRRCCASRART